MTDPLSMVRVRAAVIGEEEDEVMIVKVIAPKKRGLVDEAIDLCESEDEVGLSPILWLRT